MKSESLWGVGKAGHNSVVVNAVVESTAFRVGIGTHALQPVTDFLPLQFLLEVVFCTFGYEFVSKYLHKVSHLLAKILISFGISVDKSDYSPDVQVADGLVAGGNHFCVNKDLHCCKISLHSLQVVFFL